MKNKIFVVGSINMDMVVKTNHMPRGGETLLGEDFMMNPGGKGGNQAVAGSRLGGDVVFVGKVGEDIFGQQCFRSLEQEGVGVDTVIVDPKLHSGIALITVDDAGENSIVVAPGANAHLEPVDVETALNRYPESKILLIQLEIPMRTVEFAIRIARQKGLQVILNPAPANKAVLEMLSQIDIITPNVNEAEMLSGVRITDIISAQRAAEAIHAQGVKHVIITLGKQGAALLEDGVFYHIAVPVVEAVDTTAAGDVFNGALAVALSENNTLTDAVSFACRAASIAVTRMGAQASIPFRNEVSANIMV